MEFKELVKRAKKVYRKYNLLNQRKHKKVWTNTQIAAGFVGDVGDLMKLVLAKDGVRDVDKVDEKLAHELSDCLWSVIILAEIYKIDLEKSFVETMDQLEKTIVLKSK